MHTLSDSCHGCGAHSDDRCCVRWPRHLGFLHIKRSKCGPSTLQRPRQLHVPALSKRLTWRPLVRPQRRLPKCAKRRKPSSCPWGLQRDRSVWAWVHEVANSRAQHRAGNWISIGVVFESIATISVFRFVEQTPRAICSTSLQRTHP